MTATAPPRPPQLDRGAAAPTVARAFGWSLASTMFARVWSFGSGIALAWLLIPEDYAVYAIASLVLAVLLSVNELGVTVAVVRLRDDPAPLLPTATTISIAFSTLLYAITCAAAGALARVLAVPDAATVIRVLALGVVLDGATAVPNALLTRHLWQAKRTTADIAATIGSSAMMVVGGLAGWGAWSFVAGTLTGSAVSGALVLRFAPARPRPGWDGGHARALLHDSVSLAAASLLALAMLNVDYIVVARRLGPEALAFYVFAFNISNWMPSVLALAVRRVAIPAFARVQHDRDRFAAAFGRTAALLVAVAGTLSAVLVVCAPQLVDALYDQATWGRAAPVLRFLAVLAFARIVLDLAYDALIGLGRSATVMALQGLWLAVLIPALLTGASRHGISGVAAAHAAVALVVMLPAFGLALRRDGIGARRSLTDLRRPLVCVSLTLVTVAAIGRIEAGAWPTLIAAGSISVAALAAVLLPGGWLAARIRPADQPSG